MYQPAPSKEYTEPTITVNGEALKTVDKFTYFGSTLSRNVRIDDEALFSGSQRLVLHLVT